MLEVTGLSKSFSKAKRDRHDGSAAVAAVHSVSFRVQEGEFCTLLGPSGCGKSTTLRCIAGLEDPDVGSISIGSQVVFSSRPAVRVKPNKRGLGMVFQSYAIWPHMTVFKNASFGLDVRRGTRKLPSQEVRERVMDVLARMELDSMSERSATALSGGQQQRLALARALVTRPKVLLLDEPLSNLDARLRDQLRFELKRIQREFGVTTLYVTHDQHEALSLSDRIVVMRAGEIEQIGTPAEIYDKPASQFVTEFIGDSNCVAGKVENARGAGAERRCDVVTDLGLVPQVACPDELADGAAVTLAIRPHRAVLTTERDLARPAARRGPGLAVPGSVSTVAFNGESRDYVVAVGARELRVREGEADAVPVGASVEVFLPSAACMLTARGDG